MSTEKNQLNHSNELSARHATLQLVVDRLNRAAEAPPTAVSDASAFVIGNARFFPAGASV